MTDYTNITENFGDTICQEFLEKTKEKFKNYPLVPKENECLYWLGDKDLMKGLTQKLNSYFNTINDNEFIVGFIIFIFELPQIKSILLISLGRCIWDKVSTLLIASAARLYRRL